MYKCRFAQHIFRFFLLAASQFSALHQMLQSATPNQPFADKAMVLPPQIFGTLHSPAAEELAKLADASLLYYDAYQGCVRFPFPCAAEGLRRAQAAGVSL
jgi:hypothetical protein